MPQLTGKEIHIVPRVPYVPIEPWDWFAENGIEDKGGPPPMGEGPRMTPSVHIQDGVRVEGNAATVYGGEITDERAEDVRIVSYDGMVGGIYAEGPGTNYVVEGAVISLSGDGQGLGEQSAGAGVSNHAQLTLKDCLIDVTGANRTATSASGGSVLKVYDSALISHGAPYGDDVPEGAPKHGGPPAPLEIQGNNRTHCTVQNSYSYFYNSLITCDGWAALSTDASNGFVYLEANNCKVVSTKSGYGAYADWGCHDVFNDCKFDVACQAAIIAGEASVKFTGSDLKCGTYLALMHCVMGRHTEVGELTLTDCDIRTGKTAVEVHGQNVVVSVENCTVETGGALMRTCKNADPNAARVNGRPVPGDELHLTDMSVTGDILHEDPERDMRVYLSSTCLSGAIVNAALMMDQGSRWYATGDSTVTLGQTVDVCQIDAPAGITITASAADGQGTYTLASGGILIVE